MFHVIQDAYCIIRSKRGVYKQTKVYGWRNGLYIGAMGGFVRLMTNGNVGTPDISYVELTLPAGVSLGKPDIGKLTFTIQQL